jgi:acetyl-CoA acetyltransferase
LRKPLTMQEYLNARMIAEPLRLYDCVLPCSGGDCVILAREDLIRDDRTPRIRILGGGESHNFPFEEIYSLRGGWEQFRDRMYSQAGFGPGEMDFLQLYDDYPVMEFVQLESLGFCAPGTCASFLASRDNTIKGDLPINTGGGQLSAGQAGASGGMIGVVEAVRQLQGKGGDRQIKARNGCVRARAIGKRGRTRARGLNREAVAPRNADQSAVL